MENRATSSLTLAAGAFAVLTGACSETLPEPERAAVAPPQVATERPAPEVAAVDPRLVEERPREAGPARGDPIHCFVPNVPDPESGGEPLHLLYPCITPGQELVVGEPEPSEQDLARAEATAEGLHQRAVALELERAVCEGLNPEEMRSTPFVHHQEIVRVEEVKVAGELQGARVHFAKVPGLEIGRLEHAIRCHQARAVVMGYDPKGMSDSPLMVAPTSTTVEDLGATIAVTIVARRAWDAEDVVSRAKRLTATARSR